MKCLLRRGLRIDFDLRPSLAPRSRLAETAAVFLGFPDFDSDVGKRQSRTNPHSSVSCLGNPRILLDNKAVALDNAVTVMTEILNGESSQCHFDFRK